MRDTESQEWETACYQLALYGSYSFYTYLNITSSNINNTYVFALNSFDCLILILPVAELNADLQSEA